MLLPILTIVAIFLGPLVAVWITLWWQGSKDRRDAQRQLFVKLMAQRKTYPPPYEWVNALNVIDVVFADHQSVVARWHEYYDLLSQKEPTPAQSYKYLEMLSEMAKVLGFRSLQQTDIDKFYSPYVHGTQAQMLAETQAELLRVLKNTGHFVVAPKLAVADHPTPVAPPDGHDQNKAA
jgi:hypothetical protein